MKSGLWSYKWTYLVGLVFLGSLLWSYAFRNGFYDILVIVALGLCFVLSIMASIILAVTHRTRQTLIRVVMNIVMLFLIFPTIEVSGFLSQRLFLARLPRFQEATDLLIRNERAKGAETFAELVDLPAAYANLRVANKVYITGNNARPAVLYFSRDSSALGHSGYAYLSDDSPEVLEKQHPKVWCRRVAPHWFYFVD